MSDEIRRTIVSMKIRGGGTYKRYFVKFDCGHVRRFPEAVSAKYVQVGRQLRCRDCEFIRDNKESR